MATLLYRLGRGSYRRPFLVIAAWLLLVVLVVGGGFALGGKSEESFAIPGTESQDALDRLEAVFPQVAGASVQAIVVAEEGETVTTDATRAVIAEMVEALTAVDGVDGVVGPFDEYAGTAVTDDERMARIQVQLDGASEEVSEETLAGVTATESIGEDAGLRVEFGGQVFQDNTFGITISEVFGVIFAGVVLLVTFGSLIAAGMPLLSALVGVAIVIGGITGVSAFATVSSTAPLLALMIGLAVGIDYSLFILSRHRNQLAAGMDAEESAATSVGTAGTAVVFAGITVIIALLGLLVVGIPFLSVMGVGAAFAVLVAIAVAVTLLPALLGLAKARLAPRPGSRAHARALAHDDPSEKPTFGLRWVGMVMKAPIVAVVGVIAILGALAIPALSLDLNLPDNGSEPAESTQRQAYDLVNEGFGPGYNGPLIVAIDITQTTDVLADLESIGDELATLDDVAEVSQGAPDAGLDTAIIQVIPDSAPDSTETKALVQEIRDRAPAIEDEYGTEIFVTGATAVGIDISNRLTNALVPFGLVVVGLSVILLMMVFRSVLVPVKAALGFLLSVVASFGVVVAIFQWGFLADLLNVENPGPILSFMPILLMAVLFGLAMDYEVFLVSGMREEFVKTGDARMSVRRGFGSAARVVTAAALIMFFVFFAFVPEGSGTIKPIALGLAVGIAFDAFLVRMTLVPAVMTLLGRSAWWLPAWLGRLLPDLDIEGERLRHHLTAERWAAGQQGAAISAEQFVPVPGHLPLSLRAEPGDLVLLQGPDAARGAALAAVAGVVPPVSGELQVAGHPLPSAAKAVGRLVAVATAIPTPGGDAAGALGQQTLRELLEERIRAARPGGGREGVQQAVESRLAELRAVSLLDADGLGTDPAGTDRARTEPAGTDLPRAGSTGPDLIDPDLPVSLLSPLAAAVARGAAALAEGAPFVVLDEGASLAGGREAGRLSADERAWLRAVSQLAAPETTLVVGLAGPAGGPSGALAARSDLGGSLGRHVVLVDLDHLGERGRVAQAAHHADSVHRGDSVHRSGPVHRAGPAARAGSAHPADVADPTPAGSAPAGSAATGSAATGAGPGERPATGTGPHGRPLHLTTSPGGTE